MSAGPLARAAQAEHAAEARLLDRPGDDTKLTDRLLLPGRRAGRLFTLLLLGSGALTVVFIAAFVWSVATGVGLWGNNIPVAWGFPIINFVWWIGIGHAGTFISAFLLLMHRSWRSSINRLAEAMTVFALMLAGLFPILHLGRAWFFYWLVPYPSALQVWPEFKSTLPWDVAAIASYFTVSVIFLYVGLLPELAAARDRARGTAGRIFFGVLALGWNGSARQWHQHRVLYLILAGLATPLVISVHSIVSLDFAVALLPGWHSTIFPVYFVIGAIQSGLAMVLVLLVPIRRTFGLESVVTSRHFDNIARLLLAIGWMLIYCYIIETFVAWYGGDPYERATFFEHRLAGPNAWVFLAMTGLNVLVPQLFWSRRMRTDGRVLFVAGLLILFAMWAERFAIIALSLQRDFLPSSWAVYTPTWVDWTLFIGSIGAFLFLLLLFLRFLPFVPVAEIRRLRHELAHPGGDVMHANRDDRVAAVFDSADALVRAVHRLRETGFVAIETYSPYPLPELDAPLRLHRSRIPLAAFMGGGAGATAAYFIQWWANAVSYPLNAGGRPAHAAPAFVFTTFETLVVFAAVAAFLAFLLVLRLPRLWLPVFELPGFERASSDRFWLVVEPAGGMADAPGAIRLLEAAGALEIIRGVPT